MEFEEGFLDRYLAQRMGGGELARELVKQSRQGHLCVVCKEGQPLPLNGAIVADGERYYLQKNWALETALVEQVKRLRALVPVPLPEQFERGVNESSLEPEQKDAIRSALSHALSIIYGGPGTGKTHTAATLIRLFADSFPNSCIALAAPTGKAASHLEKNLKDLPSTVTIKASTLHRLLNIRTRIDADLVVVDEGSMIDIALWKRLLSAIGDKTRLVVLGDPDQLPPIEAGTLFAEMAPLFGVCLSRCMRTDVSALHQLAASIRSGNAPLEQLSPLTPESMVQLLQTMAPWMGDEKPEPQAVFEKYRSLGIVNALKKGPFGVDAIHRQFIDWMGQKLRGRWWAMPILVTVNEPRLDLYNGTLGVLVGRGEKALFNLHGTAYFPVAGTLVPYDSPPPIEPAFCLSIHKAQGSEFDSVIALFPPGSERLGREALYTAVTRAKKSIQLFGDVETLQGMVKSRARRMSGFTERLSV